MLFEAAEAAPGSPAVTAGTTSGYAVGLPNLASIVVGHAGAVIFIGSRETTVTIDSAPDLFGVTSERLDAFVVGARGTVIHAQARGVEFPRF
jgi:hypothetical protein